MYGDQSLSDLDKSDLKYICQDQIYEFLFSRIKLKVSIDRSYGELEIKVKLLLDEKCIAESSDSVLLNEPRDD